MSKETKSTRTGTRSKHGPKSESALSPQETDASPIFAGADKDWASQQRRAFVAVARLKDRDFAELADWDVERIGQMMLDMHSTLESLAGMGRMVQLTTAIYAGIQYGDVDDVGRCRRADELIKLIETWAYGSDAEELEPRNKVAVRPGMIVEGTPADGGTRQGTVLSIAKHGCFIHPEEGDYPAGEHDVVGCPWSTVRVLASDPSEGTSGNGGRLTKETGRALCMDAGGTGPGGRDDATKGA